MGKGAADHHQMAGPREQQRERPLARWWDETLHVIRSLVGVSVKFQKTGKSQSKIIYNITSCHQTPRATTKGSKADRCHAVSYYFIHERNPQGKSPL